MRSVILNSLIVIQNPLNLPVLNFHIPGWHQRWGRGATAPCLRTLHPRRGKLNNSSGNDIRGDNFKYWCLFSQTGKRKNKSSALNLNNKSGEEFLRENRGE